MAGSPEAVMEYQNLKLKRVMDECHVNEETAEKLLVMASTLAQEQMDRWLRNSSKMRRNIAEDIYKLLKKLKPSQGDSEVLNMIEEKILRLRVEDY